MELQEMMETAKKMTRKVKFLNKKEEKEMYRSALIGAMQWSERIDSENEKLNKRKSRINYPTFNQNQN